MCASKMIQFSIYIFYYRWRHPAVPGLQRGPCRCGQNSDQENEPGRAENFETEPRGPDPVGNCIPEWILEHSRDIEEIRGSITARRVR